MGQCFELCANPNCFICEPLPLPLRCLLSTPIKSLFHASPLSNSFQKTALVKHLLLRLPSPTTFSTEMEFWGVEVKAGEKLKVQPQYGRLIHISQASMGEVKDTKGSKNVPLRVRINNKNFVIGSLSTEDRPQAMFDLVFEKEFELSHDWKNGSIYFIGYIADDNATEGEEFSSDDDEFENELLEAQGNGLSKANNGILKPVAAKEGAKNKAKKEEEPDSEDDDDNESDSDDEMAVDGIPEIDSSDVSEDDSDDEDEDESEEESPKVQQSKKRPAGSAGRTPVPKKTKSATPEKSGKKGQNATPAPSKSAGKTKEQTPKSGGQHSCKSCNKTFNSENAMQSHAKAKHGGK